MVYYQILGMIELKIYLYQMIELMHLKNHERIHLKNYQYQMIELKIYLYETLEMIQIHFKIYSEEADPTHVEH